MDMLIAFIVFTVSMVLAITTGYSMVIALLIGLVAFLLTGKRRGFSFSSMGKMGLGGIKESLIVIKVMLIIGVLTAVWRISGTIIVFVYYGAKLIVPPLFLLITFVLCCLLSYAIGTSFGIAGTVGVIFMAIARSGGVDPVISAGVILSAIYFGDRCSPVSSSANMVAGVTGTKIFDNVKLMMKTGLLPLLITLVIYAALSVANPIERVDDSVLRSLEEAFSLSPLAFIPAALVILLPLFKVGVINAMLFSIAGGIVVAIVAQGAALPEILKTCVFGYASGEGGVGALLEGGGIVSMLEIVVILLISSAYSGIFNGTKMLESFQNVLGRGCSKFGRFVVTTAVSLAVTMIFCNQTIGVLMCNDMMKKPYADAGASKTELAIDMENSIILIACTVPWSIGCSVPLALLGTDARSVLFAVYMFLVPICYFLTKKKWFGRDRAKA